MLDNRVQLMGLTDAAQSFIARTCPNCCASNSIPQVLAECPADELSFEELKRYWYGFLKNRCFLLFIVAGIADFYLTQNISQGQV